MTDRRENQGRHLIILLDIPPDLDEIDKAIRLQLRLLGYKDKEISYILSWLDNNDTNPIYSEVANMIDTSSKSDVLEKLGYKQDDR